MYKDDGDGDDNGDDNDESSRNIDSRVCPFQIQIHVRICYLDKNRRMIQQQQRT